MIKKLEQIGQIIVGITPFYNIYNTQSYQAASSRGPTKLSSDAIITRYQVTGPHRGGEAVCSGHGVTSVPAS